MNLEYLRLKTHFKKKTLGEDVSNDDISVDSKIVAVHDHLSHLMSRMDDEKYDADSQIHTLKCLSKFLDYDNVKKFLVKKSRETSLKAVKAEIRNLYEGRLDTSELDETIENVRKDMALRKKLLKEMEDMD